MTGKSNKTKALGSNHRNAFKKPAPFLFRHDILKKKSLELREPLGDCAGIFCRRQLERNGKVRRFNASTSPLVLKRNDRQSLLVRRSKLFCAVRRTACCWANLLYLVMVDIFKPLIVGDEDDFCQDFCE